MFAPEYDVLTDTTKARLHGFHDVVDSQAMFIETFDRYRAARLIP